MIFGRQQCGDMVRQRLCIKMTTDDKSEAKIWSRGIEVPPIHALDQS